MEAHLQVPMNGHVPVPAKRTSELLELRAAFSRQAHVIDTLTEAVTRFRTGATALKADNSDLRGELARLRGFRRVSGGDTLFELAQLADIRLGIDAQAAVVSRAVLISTLEHRVSASVLDDAKLVASELVANSVLHSGASPDDTLIFRVRLSSTMVRLEVEDPSRGATIAPGPADFEGGGGFGLNLVDSLSESWGVERATTATRVWAQLALRTGPDPAETLPAL